MLQRLNNNPIVRLNIASRERTQHNTWKTRLLWLTPLLLVALIPSWLYVDQTREDVLILMLLVMFGASLGMTIYTAALVYEITRRLRFLSGDNDLLMLSNISPKTYVEGVWWTAFRYVWKEYVLLALPRIGLAYGLAQYLHTANLPSIFLTSPSSRLLQIAGIYPVYSPAFQYISHNGAYVSLNPYFDTVLIGSIVLMGLSIFEAGFFTALITLAALTAFSNKSHITVAAIVFRTILMIGVAQVIMTMNPTNHSWRWEIFCCCCGSCGGNDCNGVETDLIRGCQFRSALRVLETGQVTLSVLSDGGVLLAANIMRPLGEGSGFGKLWKAFRVGQDYDYRLVLDTNLLFVLRNVLSAILGVIMYVILTWGILRLTRLAAFIRGYGH